jgi:hypothetical protein
MTLFLISLVFGGYIGWLCFAAARSTWGGIGLFVVGFALLFIRDAVSAAI